MSKGWVMHSHNHFTREENGYFVTLTIGDSYPMWYICKDDEVIDAAPYHSPVTSSCNKELAAKAQIEKILKDLGERK